MEGGDWDERKFYSIDLEKQDVEEICDKLIEFLGKENVFSGKALHNAKEMRKSTHRKTKIRQTLPEIWKARGTFLGKDPYKKGHYQENFAEYIRQEQLLHLSKQPNLGHARKEGRLPDWVLSEVRPQIRTILESEKK